ncbi:nucleotide exchange factor GrpE [Micromonospora inositola]|uniref:Protein GrpE n=1 Tax=Micromonospora inositola TaxID=47865 RepID=A0A1C5HSJ8_9ACTN|nr:nucleotide exchange factor GrpE [Micromonospora inositola]SCG48918.1 molecular chaperone GrpE [Micromonospora inositola]
MTEKPRAADPGSTGSAPGGSATAGKAAGEEPRVVIRDKRKIRKTGESTTTAADAAADTPAEGLVEEAEVVVDEIEVEADAVDGPAPAGPPVVDAPAQPTEGGGSPLGAELESLRAELDERTRDLQRVSAEYANYRKRVDRDRSLVQEQAIGTVLAALLPILDDLDRARDHGDLVGPFGAVAEQLTTALGKFGLTAFGEQGDPFDPTRHEAVAHQTSADVTEPTCVQVMRRGYQLGERLLRPALVAVADPE